MPKRLWGWGSTKPQPLPKDDLAGQKDEDTKAIQKKETEVSLSLTNFVLHMIKHLNSAQRYHLFVEHQNQGTRKSKTQVQIARELGVHPSTVSREYRRNATAKGGYNDTIAQQKAEERKSRSAPNNKKSDFLWWRIE